MDPLLQQKIARCPTDGTQILCPPLSIDPSPAVNNDHSLKLAESSGFFMNTGREELNSRSLDIIVLPIMFDKK